MSEQILTVFIVDDEKLIRDGMKKLYPWERNGFRLCGEADNGRDALEEILRVRPDIVLTDLRMPRMDGLALCSTLKQQCPTVETVIVTGYDEFAYAREAVKAGVFDFLLKPVSPVELESTMVRLRAKIESRSVGYPFADEQRLVSAVLQQQTAEAFAIVDGIFERFTHSRANPEDVRNISLKLIATVEENRRRNSSSYTAVERPDIPPQTDLTDLHMLVTNYLTRILRKETNETADWLVEKVKQYLEENYRQNISLKLLETEFFFNASYISRIFKAKVGMNYSDYLLDIRISHAKELLKTSTLSISQISEAVGFGNSKYFSRVFKNATGMQPIAYRNAEHEENTDEE